jgi:TPR repeat protein
MHALSITWASCLRLVWVLQKMMQRLFRWFRLAATQGHADAQCKLGMMFKLGRGVAKNVTEAIHWYNLAAAQGHKQAQLCLDNLFWIREGVS